MPKQLFEKGKSGNPNGRPKGAKSKAVLIRDQLINALEKDAVNVVKAIVKKALEGDMQAAKIIMDRLIPQQKAVISGEEGMRQPVVNIVVGSIDKANSDQQFIDVKPIKIEREDK
jgi:hypothetical protein